MQEFTPGLAEVSETLGACPVFDIVTDEARDALAAAFDGVRIETGEVLMRQGDEADALYVVRHGRLRTTATGADGSCLDIGEVGKGEVVGEMALITDDRRSATVTAMRDSELYRLPAKAFVSLTVQHPEILRPFAGVVVNRLRATLTRPSRPSLPATIVVLPTRDADVSGFAHELAEAITDYRTEVVTPTQAADQTPSAAWLLELENAVDVSLLVADYHPTEWTRQCLRHADRVFMVADEGASAARTPVEQDPACAERLSELPVSLVMRYRHRPTTSRWYPGRQLFTHHNLLIGSVDDVQRLVRRLTGQATVLVLGGGGARGFAHFGAIKALRDGGVPIDAIVGTSAGALVGGGLARHGDLDLAEPALLNWFDEVRWRRDFNPPTLSLTTGRLMTEGFQAFFGDWMVEDLTVDYAAVSCDLVAAEPCVHTSGPLWQAIRCSVAVPGLFPPVALGDRLLVDGGLVANLPVGIAAARHPGARIVAVDVGDPTGIDNSGIDGSGVVNGWNLLRRRGSGVTLARVLMRLTELGQSEATDLADIVIRPDVSGFGLTDTKPARTIMQRGYEAAEAAVASGRFD